MSDRTESPPRELPALCRPAADLASGLGRIDARLARTSILAGMLCAALGVGAGFFTAYSADQRAPITLPRPDHIVLVIEENHSYREVIGSPAAPYINSLARQGAVFTQSFGLTHPSQPNYLALFSGSMQGVADNSCPHTFTTPNLGSTLATAGLTFHGYSEDLPFVGSTACTTGTYARRHNPWSNWQESTAHSVPAASNMPFTSFPADFATLPTVSIVIPNVRHDMHDGVDPDRIRIADQWLRQHLDSYVQWAMTHHSLLILTWDEDDRTENNRVPTIFIGSMVRPGFYNEKITHSNVLRTIEDLYGLPHPGASAGVSPITDVWVSRTAPHP